MSGSGEETDLESLLGGVAPRPEPPDAVRDRVFVAVQGEWRRQQRRRWRIPVAMAASLLVAVAAALLTVMHRPDDVLVQITGTGGLRVNGVLHDHSDETLVLAPASELVADGDSRLVTADGVEVRLRSGTRVTWQEPAAVALDHGAVYVDTGGRSHLQVRTPLGVVSDLGTTFMVTVGGGTMEVAMRHGTTSIDTSRGTYTAQAHGGQGDVVVVAPQQISTRTEPASAVRWQWIQSVHPGYTQREVVPLLQAIADDLGVGLEFASPEVRAAAQQSRLEGNLDGLGPEQALQVVLGTAGLARRKTSDGTLMIEFQSPDR